MGIPGLTSYVNDIKKLWTKLELKNTKLVVDGNALLYYLCRSSGIECKCGGEYDELAGVLTKFFDSLRSNHVEPYVIVDGAMDPSEKKLDTLVSRAKNKIKAAANLSKSDGQSELLLPRLAKITMYQVMRELEIKFAVCDCEADQEVASLANQFGCPAISFDSDFLILNIEHGYIPLSTLHWHSQPPSAELYKRERLAAHLNIPPDILPLFASLLGNDFISSQTLEPFELTLKRIELSKNVSKRVSRFLSVAHFLSASKSIKEGLEVVLSQLKREVDKEDLRHALEVSLEGYVIPKVNLSDYFEQNSSRTSLRTVSGEMIPDWVIYAYRQGLFSYQYVDILTTGMRFLPPQVENMTVQSANCCTAVLRMIIYGIMESNNDREWKKENRKLGIKEWNRDGKGLKNYFLKPVHVVVKGFGELPSLENIPDVLLADRRNIVLTLLESNTPAVTALPDDLQLIVACCRFLLSNADPEISTTHLDVVIVTLLEFYHSVNEEVIRHEDLNARSGWRFLRKLPRNTSFSLALQHSLAQWQAVMYEGICLNQVLAEPLPTLQISGLYSGVTAHWFLHQLQKGKTPESLTKRRDLYRQLRDAMTGGLIHKLVQDRDWRNRNSILPATQSGSQETPDESAKKTILQERKAKKPPVALAGNRFGLLCDSDSDSSEEQ